MASFFSMLGSAVQSLSSFDAGKPKPPTFAALAEELIDLHEEAVGEATSHGARVVLQKGDLIVEQVSRLSRLLADASNALSSRSSSLSKANAQAVFDDVMGSSFVDALCTRSLANVPEGMLPLACNFLAHLIEVHPDPASMLAVGKVRRPVLNLIAVFLDTGRGESEVTTRSRKSSVRHVMHLVLQLWRCAATSAALASCLLAAADPGATRLPGQLGTLDGVMVRAVMAHARFNGKTGTLARRAALLAARVRIPSVAFWLCRGRQWESAAAETIGAEAASHGAPSAGDERLLAPVGTRAGDKPGLVTLVIAALTSFAGRLPLEVEDESAVAESSELGEVVSCLDFFLSLANDERQLRVAPPVDAAARLVCLSDQVLDTVPEAFFDREGLPDPADAGQCPCLSALVLLPEAVKQLVGSESEGAYREAAAAAVQEADIEQGLLQVVLEESLPSLPTAPAEPDTAKAVGAALMRAGVARIGSLMVDSEPCVLAASGLAMGLLRAGPTAVRATLLFSPGSEQMGLVLGLQRLNSEISRRAAAQARSGFELALIMAQQDAGWGPVAGAEELLAHAGAEDVSEARALLESRAHKPFVVRAALGFEVLKETAATLVVVGAIEAALGDS